MNPGSGGSPGHSRPLPSRRAVAGNALPRLALVLMLAPLLLVCARAVVSGTPDLAVEGDLACLYLRMPLYIIMGCAVFLRGTGKSPFTYSLPGTAAPDASVYLVFTVEGSSGPMILDTVSTHGEFVLGVPGGSI